MKSYFQTIAITITGFITIAIIVGAILGITHRNNGYTLSGMDRDSMPDFFIQKRGHLLSPRYTINSPQKS